MAKKRQFGEFNVTKLGVAAGLTWGIGCLLLGLLAMKGYGSPLVAAIGSIYIGYAATLTGSIVGAAWGFVDGFIGGAIFAWIYNKIL